MNVDPVELFEIDKCIGRGNFGDVYKAVDRASSTIVAVKVINLEESEEDVDILIQEILFLSQLRSPYITTYYSTYIKDVSLWIIMEYCGGGSCADLLRCYKCLHEDIVAFIIRDVLRGLDYLHSQRKIHRDIKAANILLTNSGQVKIADFGVSGQITNTQLKKHTFVGTPFWMAPEVITRKTGYNEKADIWSLGITTIELINGTPPYSEYPPMEILFKIPKSAPPILVGSEYNEVLKKFVKECLRRNPADRPSAKTLLQHEFLSVEIGNMPLISLIKHKNKWIMRNKFGTRKPRFPLNYNEGIMNNNTPVDWNFSTTRTKDLPIAQSTILENKKKSKNEIGECPEFGIVSRTGKVSAISSSPLVCSDSPRENPSPKSTENISEENSSDLKSSSASIYLPKDINYPNDIISYAFGKIFYRAKKKETKQAVYNLRKIIYDFERQQPGLCEALSEEIFLRMKASKERELR
ncbi:hypothetical protein PACTADRAFT_68182 [Pachysolen tannophilus NRRL Y-2460]|uniref:non-specific serine/threonine protein kinase n=1 Tax=Pachysolen tannophilus NRRL Y-2460 TaxID=669874 RepID=A0A1E4TTV5_PACTA|nr:hypothetical protein PACTADRAFT_68182 [Pachysolen tannophilus NRRL Y-2460]